MSKFLHGSKCYTYANKRVLITPDLTRIRIPENLEIGDTPPLEIPPAFQEQLEQLGIPLTPDIHYDPPPYQEELLIQHITFKDLVVGRIPFIFEAFLKNACFMPIITIDCPLPATRSLLDLIASKYNQNSINPVVKIIIREDLDQFVTVIEEFLETRESIESSNLILLLDPQFYRNNIVSNLKNRLGPLAIYLHFEDCVTFRNFLEQEQRHTEIPIMVEFDPRLNEINLQDLGSKNIYINEDSCFRLLTGFKKKKDLKTINSAILTHLPKHLEKYIFKPYCPACNSKLFIEGAGNIYPCNLGFKYNDRISRLKNDSLKGILNSQKIKEIRRKIVANSVKCQQTCNLWPFCSGCLYYDQKCTFIKSLFRNLLTGVQKP